VNDDGCTRAGRDAARPYLANATRSVRGWSFDSPTYLAANGRATTIGTELFLEWNLMATKRVTRTGKRVLAYFRCAKQRPVSPRYDLPTFCDHGPDHRTTKLHRYTACYLPELAARLIRKHSRPDETVLDSFLGSGTSVIQAVANDRRALGIDVHPAAVEIARARLAPVYPQALELVIERLKKLLGRERPKRIDLPSDPNGWDWERWFPSKSHARLAQLRRLILAVPRDDVRRLLLVATASTLKQVSYWYSHATKLQFDPTKKPLDVAEAMIPRLTEIQKINFELWEHVEGRKGAYRRKQLARLDVGNCCALPFDDDSVDLGVSSPPYFIAYDYAKLLRLTSWWILGRVPEGAGHIETAGRGMRLPNKPKVELGSVFDRVLGAAMRQMDANEPGCSTTHVRSLVRSLPPFFSGMNRALSEFLRVLRPGAKLCLVLGNTRHCGVTIPTAEIATELALLRGFRLVALHIRRQHSATQPQARNFSGQFTSEDAPTQYSYRDEYVAVLRKP